MGRFGSGFLGVGRVWILFSRPTPRIYNICILIAKMIHKTHMVHVVFGLNFRHYLRGVGREGGVFNLYRTHSHVFLYILEVLSS